MWIGLIIWNIFVRISSSSNSYSTERNCYLWLLETWYKIKFKILNSPCNLSDSIIEWVWFIVSMIFCILDSIWLQIWLSWFLTLSRTQFINSIRLLRSRVYVDSSFSRHKHNFDSSISFCNSDSGSCNNDHGTSHIDDDTVVLNSF